MKVRFSAEVLEDSNSWDSLDRIVHYFLDRRHLWDIIDSREIENSKWIQKDLGGRSGKRNLEAFQKCFTDAIYPRKSRMHTITLLITLQVKSECELPPDDAIRCLEAPAYVAVENRELSTG